VRAKLITAMDECDLAGDILEHQRPIDGRIPTADDHDAFPCEDIFFFDEVGDATPFQTIDIRKIQFLRRKGSDPYRQDDSTGPVFRLIRAQPDEPVVV